MLNINGIFFLVKKYLRAQGKISKLLIHALISTCCHHPNYKMEKNKIKLHQSLLYNWCGTQISDTECFLLRSFMRIKIPVGGDKKPLTNKC